MHSDKKDKNNDFKIYNNCLISNLAPHEVPNVRNIEAELKKTGCYLARWTDHYNQIEENGSKEWWYLIRSGDWNLSKLKSHDRNEINKGIRNFKCQFINPQKYLRDLYLVYTSATKEYSSLSNSCIDYDEFVKGMNKRDLVIAAFDIEDGRLSAYSKVYYYDDTNHKKGLNLSVMKILPEKKRKSPSAAIMNYICDYFLNKEKIDYICDGERSIRHITNFQSYLEKYFGFKKVFCRLNIVYSKKIKIIIKMLYPFRKIISALGKKNRKIYNISVLLTQEEIVKSFKK